MANRCEHCQHWVDTHFKGTSASGYGVWYGNCWHPTRQTPVDEQRHSLMFACSLFERGTHPKSLNGRAPTVEESKRNA